MTFALPPIPSDAWRHPERYAHLRRADRRMFAWEWLRRHRAYRRVWLRCRNDVESRIALRAARRFALVALEDPNNDARKARPIWRSDIDSRAVCADAEGVETPSRDQLDILRLAAFAKVAITSEGREHWIFSDGGWLLRLNIVEGTLLGGPTLLRYRLQGLAALTGRLEALGDLVALLAAPEAGLRLSGAGRTERWIAELRTADALEQGASHRQIAQGLFGDFAQSGWRMDSDAYRLRVQRLARAARLRQRSPLSPGWFER